MEIRTERLSLRPLRPEDAYWVTAEIAQPAVHRWLTSPPYPFSLADALSYLGAVADNPLYCAIWAGEMPIGVVTIGAERGLMLGYWLRVSAWGRGHMSEAAGALLAAHFERSDNPVDSGWIEGNTGSARVLQKLGFQEHGETRPILSQFWGRAVPVVQVRLTKEAWTRA